MISVGIVLVFGGYSVGSWGWVLVQGYDVSFKQWVDPFNPLTTWPQPNSVPVGQILPGSAPTSSASSGTGTTGTSGNTVASGAISEATGGGTASLGTKLKTAIGDLLRGAGL